MKIGDKIGEPTGLVGVPYSIGSNGVMDHLNTMYYHVHGTSWIYPDLGNDITLTSGAGAWSETGNIIEVIPASTLAADYDIHWIGIHNLSDVAEYQIQVFSGASGSEVKLDNIKTIRNSNFTREGPQVVHVPQIAANTRISCRLCDSTSGTVTCTVHFRGHYYV